ADFVRYVSHIDIKFQRMIAGAFTLINVYAMRQTGKFLYELTPAECRSVLNQGEARGQAAKILWHEDFLLHTAVSSIVMLARMVLLSREPAQLAIGMTWSRGCDNPTNLARVDAPPYPDLDEVYDLCVIGSGAGGAVVAARAAGQGLRVIIVEEGKWISPHSLVGVRTDTHGRRTVMPPRTDVVLMNVYKHGGVNLTGEFLGRSQNIGDYVDPERRRQIQPTQAVSLVQASVVGGG